MRGLEKAILVIFSLIMIIIAIFLVLFSTEFLVTGDIFKDIAIFLGANKVLSLICGVVIALLGLIGLFSSSSSNDEIRSGLAIKADSGTVYITKETFESIILGVTRNYNELKNVKAEISVSEYGVVANIYAQILPDTVVPTLTSKLQDNIKASVLKQTTVEIKEANIKIRGVYIEPQKK